MFPQEFIIRFAEPTKVSAMTLDSYNGMEAMVKSEYRSNAVSAFDRDKDEICQMLTRCYLMQTLPVGSLQFSCKPILRLLLAN